MKRIFIVVGLLSVFFFSCNPNSSKQEKALQDSLSNLRSKTDFRPMSEDDSYSFLNKYFLPLLDSTYIGRRLFVYSLNNRDFNAKFKDDSTTLVRKFHGDSSLVAPPVITPPRSRYNNNFVWNENRLEGVKIIIDPVIIEPATKLEHSITRQEWYEKIKPGYFIISRPLYNTNTQKLIIETWLQNTDWCGTYRYKVYNFRKENDNWVLSPFLDK